jgi:hypothetical protein
MGDPGRVAARTDNPYGGPVPTSPREDAAHRVPDAGVPGVTGCRSVGWCNDEVTFWIRNRPPEELVVILTAGTLGFDKGAETPIIFAESSAAPPAFTELTAVPLYIDMTAELSPNAGWRLDFRALGLGLIDT